jgi:hypothetical protein
MIYILKKKQIMKWLINYNKRIGWEEYFDDEFFKLKEEKEKNKIII